ncbi:hypothetical protein ACOSQ2_033086 [Xanthoceras sorbifolium]
MENGGNNSPRGGGGGARVPPKRGQIKVKIFAVAVEKVKAVTRLMKNIGGNHHGGATSSSTTTPPQSAYTSEGHSDS